MTTLSDYLERLKKLEADETKWPWIEFPEDLSTWQECVSEFTASCTAIPTLIKIIERQAHFIHAHRASFIGYHADLNKDIDNLISEAGE